MRRLFWVGVLFSVTAMAAATGYKVVKEIKIGGQPRWDYITADSAARRLYVTNGTRVVVVDLDKGTTVGEIPDTQGVHGVAIADDLGRGFASNGQANTVTIFDTKTLKPIGQPVKTGDNPDGIRYDPVSHRVLTFNGRSKNSTVIDAKTGSVVATIDLKGKPEFPVADGKGKIYDNLEDTNEIVEIDTAKAAVTKRISIKPCDGPSGLAMDTKNRRLFAVCSNRMMMVVDPDAGKVVDSPAIGASSDGVAFDPGTGYAISSNGDGTLTIVQATGGKYAVVENIATEKGARTITIDEKTHNIYLPVAKAAPPQPGQRGTQYVPDSFRVLVVGK